MGFFTVLPVYFVKLGKWLCWVGEIVDVGWCVTFVPVPSEDMKIWRGESNPRPFEGACFSCIPAKVIYTKYSKH